MSAFKRVFCILIVLIMAAPVFSLASRGNSAQRYWHGTTATGALVEGDSCPLEVENEVLTFDISGFPSNENVRDREPANAALANYLSRAKVTAEYTFYNPEPYDVTATLVFPFGVGPDYYYYAEFTGSEWGASVDGVQVTTKLRHTYSYDHYSNQIALTQLVDGYKTDDFFTPDLPVTMYFFEYDSAVKNDRASVRMTLKYGKETRVSCAWGVCRPTEDGAVLTFNVWDDDRAYTLAFMGKEPKIESVEVFGDDKYTTSAQGELRRLDGKTKTCTLKELAFEDYDEARCVSESDWYNAFVDRLLLGSGNESTYDLYHDLSEKLMQWYEYEMVVPAGEKVVNTVTAPLFPAIDGGYEPPVYEYTYLLSPAQTWEKFGTLDVIVNTQYCMIESGIGDFEIVDGGFKRSFDRLPTSELTFKLSSSPSPEKTEDWTYLRSLLIVIGCFVVAVVVGILIFALILRAVLKFRRKKEMKKKTIE